MNNYFIRPRLTRSLGVFCAALAIVILLQWRGNAFGSEFGAVADEPAHYVTGLLAHDYLVRGFPTPPMAFAQQFYSYYPKVALGHWPPVFYMAQAVWTLLFTESRVSILLLMAVITAGVLSTTYAIAARYFGGWLAAGGAIFLAATPAFQRSSRSVTAEMLVTLLTLISVLLLARHLERNSWSTGLGFGLAAACAILTKATGIALAPVPVLAASLLGRFDRFKDVRFWAPALLVAAICAPWFLLAPDALHNSVAPYGGLRLRWNRLLPSVSYWITTLGPLGASLAAIGLARTLQLLLAKRSVDPLWMLMLLILPASVMLRMWIGPWEVSYLVTTLPFLALFLCSGLSWILKYALPRWRMQGAMAGLLLAVPVARNIEATPPKLHMGLDRAAADIVNNIQFSGAPLLILSDATGEGVFIAEVARREKRPGHKVERGSKVLASSTWMGGNYQLRFTTVEQVTSFLAATPQLLVVLDTPDISVPHVELVRAAAAHPNQWEVIATYPRWYAGGRERPDGILLLRLRK